MEITFEYLKALAANNDKVWFEANKPWYNEARSEFEDLVQELIFGISEWDASYREISPKSCLFRIYKDARFNRGGEPYKLNFGAHISNGGKKGDSGAFYLHIQPGKNFVGGGIYKPQAAILKAVRNKIYHEAELFKQIISDEKFVEKFGGLMGDKLKSAPKGFDKSFPDIDLINFKQYVVMHEFENNAVLNRSFKNDILAVFKAQSDFIKFINEAIAED